MNESATKYVGFIILNGRQCRYFFLVTFQVFFDVEHDDKEFHDFAFRKKFLRQTRLY